MSRQPWDKFYYSDWRSDPALRMCSLAARGLWLEMLALMHEAEPRGQLLIKGNMPTATQLACLVGAPVEEIEQLLDELETNQVFSRKKNGVIYSRRMERKSALSEKRSAAGAKGASVTNTRQENPERKQGESEANFEGISGNGGQPNLLNMNGNLNLPRQNERQTIGPRSQRPEARGQSIKKPPSAAEKSEVDQAIEIYNGVAAELGLRSVRIVNDQRRRSLRARLKEIGGLDGWRQAMEELRFSSFCQGLRPPRVPDGKPFKADLKFLCQAESLANLLEGKYRDDTADQQRRNFDSKKHDWTSTDPIPDEAMRDRDNLWRWRLGQWYGRGVWHEERWGSVERAPAHIREEMEQRYGGSQA